jgi:hypothetical protein
MAERPTFNGIPQITVSDIESAYDAFYKATGVDGATSETDKLTTLRLSLLTSTLFEVEEKKSPVLLSDALQTEKDNEVTKEKFGLKPLKRSLKDHPRAIEIAEEAQRQILLKAYRDEERNAFESIVLANTKLTPEEFAKDLLKKSLGRASTHVQREPVRQIDNTTRKLNSTNSTPYWNFLGEDFGIIVASQMYLLSRENYSWTELRNLRAGILSGNKK